MAAPARRARILIDASRCRHCGSCVDICPEGLFVQPDPHAPPRVTRPSRCTSCGHCASICRHGAIDHADFPEFRGKE